MRIVIVEDLTLLREGLTRLLNDRGWEIVAAVDTGPALVEAVVEHRPDLALVDVRLPPTFTDEGVRAAIEARERVPGTPVLILSQYVEESYAGDLLASNEGGVGYLLKDRVADVRQFTESLQRVAGGGTAMDPEVVAQLLGRRDNQGPLAELTARELEVLALMAEGRSNTGIGAELGISGSAIEKHVKQVFSKLDLPPSEEDHRRVLAVLAYLGSGV
jgi:DNA-binding NarL/FixJ family response regulator